jgi:hypothetical protein
LSHEGNHYAYLQVFESLVIRSRFLSLATLRRWMMSSPLTIEQLRQRLMLVVFVLCAQPLVCDTPQTCLKGTSGGCYETAGRSDIRLSRLRSWKAVKAGFTAKVQRIRVWGNNEGGKTVTSETQLSNEAIRKAEERYYFGSLCTNVVFFLFATCPSFNTPNGKHLCNCCD